MTMWKPPTREHDHKVGITELSPGVWRCSHCGAITTKDRSYFGELECVRYGCDWKEILLVACSVLCVKRLSEERMFQ